MKGIGDRFQEETKYTPETIGGHGLDWNRKPLPFKTYESPIAVVPLPRPDVSQKTDLWEALQRRRSRRRYNERVLLSIQDLAELCWATQGISAEHGDTLFRTAPSAGALYPVETYLLINRVASLEQGVYHFRPDRFHLEFLRQGDLSVDFARAALNQHMVRHAQVTFLWSAVMERSKWKYRQRAYRYIYLDAGHIAQNLYLAGEALGLGVCAIAAFFDDEVNELIGLDGVEETIIYMATVGKNQ
ncbi:MAG: SagB/ThcOx family dehydrogenase [bacterium]|nr:SagB/ThcOx family dehydrogenase [bacterium]